MADKRSVRFIYVATGQPVPELIDRSRDAIYFLEEAQQLWVGDKLIADHIDPVDLDAYLSPWHVKSVDIQGEGTFVASVAFDDATGKLTFTKGTPPALAKGVDIENAPVQLGFGESVKLVKGTAVSDNTIRDDTVVYTLPELPDQIDTVEILNNNGTITVRTTYASGGVRESSITLQLAGALHFLGTSTTPVTDGGREHPKINNREMDTEQLHVGDVVRYSPNGDNNYIEFMWVEDDEGTGRWSSIGDESSYTPKTRRVDAGEGLSGGGALTEDVTISHGQTGTGEDHTYTDGELSENNFKVPTGVEVDAFGHVKGVEFGDGKAVVEAIAENKLDERLQNFYDKSAVDAKLQETLDAALAADATIEVVGEGPDVLSAVYDEEANKLTITIGEALPGVEILYDEDPEDPLEVELDEETGELRIVSEDTAGAPFIIPITKSGSYYRTEVTAPEIRAHKYNCAVQLDGVVMRCEAYQSGKHLYLYAYSDSIEDGIATLQKITVDAKNSVSVSVASATTDVDTSPYIIPVNRVDDDVDAGTYHYECTADPDEIIKNRKHCLVKLDTLRLTNVAYSYIPMEIASEYTGMYVSLKGCHIEATSDGFTLIPMTLTASGKLYGNSVQVSVKAPQNYTPNDTFIIEASLESDGTISVPDDSSIPRKIVEAWSSNKSLVLRLVRTRPNERVEIQITRLHVPDNIGADGTRYLFSGHAALLFEGVIKDVEISVFRGTYDRYSMSIYLTNSRIRSAMVLVNTEYDDDNQLIYVCSKTPQEINSLDADVVYIERIVDDINQNYKLYSCDNTSAVFTRVVYDDQGTVLDIATVGEDKVITFSSVRSAPEPEYMTEQELQDLWDSIEV